MNEAVEANYQWGTKYGLEIVNVQPMGLDWDDQSVELINKFNTGNLMQGGVGAAYAQTQIAEGFNAAGNNGGAGRPLLLLQLHQPLLPLMLQPPQLLLKLQRPQQPHK